MIRDARARRQGSSLLDDPAEINPLDTVANLSDVMLVLAVALMLLVVTYWQVDMSQPVEKELMEQVEIDESAGVSVDNIGDMSYVGSVYRDPETGDLYVYPD